MAKDKHTWWQINKVMRATNMEDVLPNHSAIHLGWQIPVVLIFKCVQSHMLSRVKLLCKHSLLG